jgi:hypothetical protein
MKSLLVLLSLFSLLAVPGAGAQEAPLTAANLPGIPVHDETTDPCQIALRDKLNEQFGLDLQIYTFERAGCWHCNVGPTLEVRLITIGFLAQVIAITTESIKRHARTHVSYRT